MWRVMSKFFLITVLFSLLFCCCKLITFEYLDIICSIDEKHDYYADENIIIHFSILPDKDDTENKIRLYEDGSTVTVDYNWNGSTVSLQPRLSWQKGQFYTLELQDALRMDDGRTYIASLYRRFTYGEQGKSFELLSNDFHENIFTLKFSKPVSIVSFSERFSLSPSTAYHTEFSDNGSTIIISPNNGWSSNTTYLWTIKNMISTDGYLMKKNYSGMFYGIIDIEQPEFEFVCPVDFDNTDSLWHTAYSLDNYLLDSQAIGFSFSKPMDETSVISGISFFPSINGHFIKETESRFVFVPIAQYQLRREYRITIADTIRDTSGLALFETKYIFFTTANQFLQVTEITFDDNTNSMPTDGSIYEYTMIPQPYPNTPMQLKTVIKFSSAIPPDKLNNAVSAISLNVLFPDSAKPPTPISAYWSDGGSRLSIEWTDFSISSVNIKNYYMLKISGGQQGVINQANEYLEEDVCVIFITF